MEKKFIIKKSNDEIQINEVKLMLSDSYWASNRDIKTIEKSIENSICYGAFSKKDSRQIGFARVITDYATIYYICDVIVNEEYRGHGIGKALIQAVTTDELFCNMNGLLLTGDAHELYKQFGFNVLNGRCMVNTEVPEV